MISGGALSSLDVDAATYETLQERLAYAPGSSYKKNASSSLLTLLPPRQACIALSNHVLADPSFLCESTSPIVELGAGAGLLSLLAARVSRRTVVSTDVDPSVLIQLEVNISLS